MRRASYVLALLVLGLLCTTCRRSTPPAASAGPSTADRAQGISKDDQARCEWRGRRDRDVSEATAPGAFAPNIRRVWQLVGQGTHQRRVLVCREVDTNLDGVKDVTRLFNDKGEALREEADTNHDGKIDSWITFAKGRIAKQVDDLNGDGKEERWKYYSNGKLSRIQRDTNADGKPDVWEIYLRGRLERIGVDVDHDGRVDRWDRDELERRATETRERESAAQDAGAPPTQDAGGAAPPDAGRGGAKG